MAALSWLLAAAPVAAQERPHGEALPGDSVRITLIEHQQRRQVIGRLEHLDSSLLMLRTQHQSHRYGTDEVLRIERLIRRSRRAAHIPAGAVIGGVAGFGLAKVIFDHRYQDDQYNGAAALVVGLPAGALAGVLVGMITGQERWRRVSLPGYR